MRSYLVKMCKKDGSTPLGECPEYEIEVDEMERIHHAHDLAVRKYPDQEVVSIGLKMEILAYERKYNIPRGEV